MTDFEFGITMTLVGMGSTLLILFLISIVVQLLGKCLPVPKGKKE
ncbi:MAG: OadG family protein [Deltaproteobacteria bacterium]|nr:OadG family protein [Deltaproteobacteria bacterium]